MLRNGRWWELPTGEEDLAGPGFQHLELPWQASRSCGCGGPEGGSPGAELRFPCLGPQPPPGSRLWVAVGREGQPRRPGWPGLLGPTASVGRVQLRRPWAPFFLVLGEDRGLNPDRAAPLTSPTTILASVGIIRERRGGWEGGTRAWGRCLRRQLLRAVVVDLAVVERRSEAGLGEGVLGGADVGWEGP